MSGHQYIDAAATLGQAVARNLACRHLYQVAVADRGSSRASFYVYDAGQVVEATRIERARPEEGRGAVALEVRDGDSMRAVVTSDAAQTTFRGSSGAASFDATGLSFDTQGAAIYFGAARDFRLQFQPAGPDNVPACLALQARGEAGGEYVEKLGVYSSSSS